MHVARAEFRQLVCGAFPGGKRSAAAQRTRAGMSRLYQHQSGNGAQRIPRFVINVVVSSEKTGIGKHHIRRRRFPERNFILRNQLCDQLGMMDDFVIGAHGAVAQLGG